MNGNANRILQTGPLLQNFGKFGIRCTLSQQQLQQLLLYQKNPVGKNKVAGSVYKHSYDECKATCVDETKHSLKARFREHRRQSSTTSSVSQHIHMDSPISIIMLENIKILSMEHKLREREVKEAIYIQALKPSFNRDEG